MENARPEEPAVPVGLEQVLLLAGVEPRLGEALAADPDGVLAASGVDLTTTERAILRTVDQKQIGQMAARLVSATPEPTRRAFLGQASVVLVALGAGAGLAGGCGDKPTDSGRASSEKKRAAEMRALAKKRQREMARRHRVTAPTGIRPRYPQMTAGKPVIKGPLDTSFVRQNLRARGNGVRTCWLSKNRHHPPLGELRLELTVDKRGKVSKASFGAGTLGNSDVESCILTAARAWTFPPSRPRPTTIKITYNFELR